MAGISQETKSIACFIDDIGEWLLQQLFHFYKGPAGGVCFKYPTNLLYYLDSGYVQFERTGPSVHMDVYGSAKNTDS